MSVEFDVRFDEFVSAGVDAPLQRNREVQQFARACIEEAVRHGWLPAGDWAVKLDNAKVRGGQCNYRTRTISVSRHFISWASAEMLRDVVLHELAHACCFTVDRQRGHGVVWQRWCRRLGMDHSDRCYDYGDAPMRARGKYAAWCPLCERFIGFRWRLPKDDRFCGLCVGKLTWVEVAAVEAL